MKQHEAVIQTLEKLGGQATLAQLYLEVMKVTECEWKTKTPFASIRRIVQTRPEIFKVRPGLWALETYKARLGLEAEATTDQVENEINHSYYQGLLVTIGNIRGFYTYVPNQDKNKRFVEKTLGEIRSLPVLPSFSHDFLVRRSSTIDVIWFNSRQMPNSMFEVEFSTDIQNSLLKFFDLQDFYTRMVIVAHEKRRAQFDDKLNSIAFKDIKNRVNFLEYESLVTQYETTLVNQKQDFLV